jgi:hypothetical protein
MKHPRGFIAALAAFAILGGNATFATAISVNDDTLHVYVPGSFSGCTWTSGSSSPAFRSLMDLTKPSAFLPSSIGRLIGVRGPIASAELVSLNPQTVAYTIDPSFQWSNGEPFSITDLTDAIALGKSANASWADGYHHIVSYTIGPKLKTLRVIFDNHYSEWAGMFRALEHRALSGSCSPSQVVAQPSLGPYSLLSLSSRVAVLQANESWPHHEQMYKTIIMEAGVAASQIGATPFVDLRYSFTSEDLTASSSHADRSGKIGVSNRLSTILFSPRRYLPSQPAVREYLSASLNRQLLINELVGEQTFALAPANSNLFGQAQIGYTGASGLSPVTQMTMPDNVGSPFTGTSDCLKCAAAMIGAGRGLRQSLGVTSYYGIPLTLRLAVGPSSIMQRLGRLVQKQWRAAGVGVYVAHYATDLAAANAVAYGASDAALVEQYVGPVSTSATSWYGPRRSNQLDAGWRSETGNGAAIQALSTFNPIDALSSWRALDTEIARNFWARPLFSLPYYLRWSSSISAVLPSNSLDGLICQVTLWNAPRNS